MPRLSKRSKSMRTKRSKQRGGVPVLPAEYFNPDVVSRYGVDHGSMEGAVSHGVVNKESGSSGPDLKASLNQTGGAPLPLAYFTGGDSSNTHFEAGAPELQNCTSPYGVLHPVSHGVVLDAPNGSNFDADGLFAGPNLAAAQSPNTGSDNLVKVDMTGGRRKRSRRNSKSKRSKRNSKSKRSKRNSKSKRNLRKRNLRKKSRGRK